MSAKATIIGIVTDVFPGEIRGNFEKRVCWIKETDAEKYPEHYSVEFHQANGNLLDKFKSGDHVRVEVNVRGKKWSKDGKESIFNSLVGWKIEKVGQQPASQPAAPQAQTPAIDDEPLNDLPF